MTLNAQQMAVRAQGIGGSDMAAVLGIDPYKTRYQLYLEKIGADLAPVADSLTTLRGNLLEDPIAQLYIAKKRTQGEPIKLRRRNQTFRHPDYEFLLGHIDRDVVGERRGVEIKQVSWRMAREWGADGSDQVPDHYLVQINHYLLVTDYEAWELAAFIGGDELRIYHFERDPQWDSLIIQAGDDFWHNHVKPRTPPPIDYEAPTTGRLLKRLYPGTDGTRIELDHDLIHWHDVRQQALDQVKRYQAVADGATNHLLNAMGQSSIGKLPDGSGYTRKMVKKKGFTVPSSEYIDFRYRKKL